MEHPYKHLGLSCVNEEIMMSIYKHKPSSVLANALVVHVSIKFYFKTGGNLRSMQQQFSLNFYQWKFQFTNLSLRKAYRL